ncbi:MAG: DUF5060 domain-containing protein [Anaerolineaceae bacterium]|nr:DUF5060 domain-containing protein [Anaerolineaceae bacterium]
MRFFRGIAVRVLAGILILSVTPVHSQEPVPEITSERYVPLTFQVQVDPTTYSNPFDPDDIELLGIFEAPDGQQVVIPGFWMQPYENRCPDCETEDLQPAGEPVWLVRFTPFQVGEWSYIIQVQDDRTTIETLEEGQFTVTPSTEPGFVHVGANNRYFQFDNGQSYFPIGHSIKWSWDDAGGVNQYINWLRQLHEFGGNYARLIIDTPWFIGLEWDAPAGDYTQAQQAAARLDIILEAAAEYDIKLQLVLLWHQALTIYGGPPVLIPPTFDRPDTTPDWDNNPYNVIYGGPIAGPSVFFYNERAQQLFRRRLQYIVARWGYSPQIFAWEIIDRLDRTGDYNAPIAGEWLANIASYLKQIDGQHHLVTASTFNFDSVIAANPLLDFTSGEFYQSRPIETRSDQVAGAVSVIRHYLEANPAPTLLVDYSLNPWYEPADDDLQGIHVQNTLWAAALSGSAGGAASDWWYSYLIPRGLQALYTPLEAFTTGIDWANLNLQPAEAGLITEEENTYTAVRVSDFNRLFSAPPLATIEPHNISPDGVFPPVDNVSSFLYGQTYNSQFSQAQIYRVSLPTPAYIEIGVRRVSSQANARLAVTVDGESALTLDLNANSTNISLRVPLFSGEHEIILDNTGDDWLELDFVEVGGLIAPARVLTLRDLTNGVALAWLQHRDYTWEKATLTSERTPIQAQYTLAQMPSGLYTVEIWNPLTGNILGEELVRVGDDHQLQVTLLPFDSQLALRIFRRSDSFIQPTPTPQVATIVLTVTPSPTATNTPEPTTLPLFPTNTPRPQ